MYSLIIKFNNAFQTELTCIKYFYEGMGPSEAYCLGIIFMKNLF